MADPTGERGPHGDHGQEGNTGDSGDTGVRGEAGRDGQTGLAGLPGERGKTGDMGQAGHMGQEGARGRTGEAGSPPLSRAQTVAMFLFVLSAFVLLAYRTEVNANRNQDNFSNNKDDTYEACSQVNRTSLAVNEILDQLIAFQGNAPPRLPPAEEKKRDNEYRDLKITALECPKP